jgi:hypothetical protein
MILTMRDLPRLPGATELARNLIGIHIFVNWPMMHEAKVSPTLAVSHVLFYSMEPSMYQH